MNEFLCYFVISAPFCSFRFLFASFSLPFASFRTMSTSYASSIAEFDPLGLFTPDDQLSDIPAIAAPANAPPIDDRARQKELLRESLKKCRTKLREFREHNTVAFDRLLKFLIDNQVTPILNNPDATTEDIKLRRSYLRIFRKMLPHTFAFGFDVDSDKMKQFRLTCSANFQSLTTRLIECRRIASETQWKISKSEPTTWKIPASFHIFRRNYVNNLNAMYGDSIALFRRLSYKMLKKVFQLCVDDKNNFQYYSVVLSLITTRRTTNSGYNPLSYCMRKSNLIDDFAMRMINRLHISPNGCRGLIQYVATYLLDNRLIDKSTKSLEGISEDHTNRINTLLRKAAPSKRKAAPATSAVASKRR